MDSNVIVASFLDTQANHERGRSYIEGLESGSFIFYLPMLVVVEVTAAIRRQVGSRPSGRALLATWRTNIHDWEAAGRVLLYELTRSRMQVAQSLAERDRLKGADAVVAGLAEELSLPLITFDSEVLGRFLKASR